MPPPSLSIEERSGPTAPEQRPPLNLWVRGALLGIVLGLVAVFATAIWLKPYDKDGQPLHQEVHTQLGLERCTFYVVTGYPCPACGMTTSFAHLVRGRVLSSLQSNSVGTLLAAFCMLFLPWGAYAAARGRSPFVRSLEGALMIVVLTLLGLMVLRWGLVVALMWYSGTPVRF